MATRLCIAAIKRRFNSRNHVRLDIACNAQLQCTVMAMYCCRNSHQAGLKRRYSGANSGNVLRLLRFIVLFLSMPE